jgi:hypothetical protein
VSADVGECSVTADDAGFFSFNIGEHDIEGATLAELAAFRAVLNSGAFERLYAASVAWGRGDAEPPTFAEEPQSDYRRGWDDGLRTVFELAKRRSEERRTR